MKDKLWSTLLHTLELGVLLGVVYVVVAVLKLEIQGELLLIILAAVAKFARVSTKDFVNN